MSRIRVLVVDRGRDFVEGLQAWFKDDPHIEIVAAVLTAGRALTEIESTRPDLVLLDAGLKPAGGFELARRIKAIRPAPAVVLMSFVSSQAARQAALAAGADRFLAKSEVVEGLAALARELVRQERAAEPPVE